MRGFGFSESGVIRELCRGEAGTLGAWLDGMDRRRAWDCVCITILGCGAYGFSLGMWRAPLMGVFVAVKLPLLVFLTLAVNGLLNI